MQGSEKLKYLKSLKAKVYPVGNSLGLLANRNLIKQERKINEERKNKCVQMRICEL